MSSSILKPTLSIITTALIALAACFLYNRYFTTQIAYLEPGKILENFNEAITARKLLAAESVELQKQVSAQQDTIKIVFDKFKAATGSQKAKLQAEFTRRNTQYNEFYQAAQEKSVRRENEVMGPVSQKINTMLEVWGRQHHYDIILGNMGSGNIVRADKKLDVTAKVIADLNKKDK
jgi:outer membrane protein